MTGGRRLMKMKKLLGHRRPAIQFSLSIDCPLLIASRDA